MKKSFEKFNAFLRFSLFCLLAGMTLMSFTRTDTTNCLLPEVSIGCPTAGFSVANTVCLVNEEVIFVNESLNAESYNWDFGDGNSSTQENPRHRYQQAGNFTVTLTATAGSCQQSYIGVVEVLDN